MSVRFIPSDESLDRLASMLCSVLNVPEAGFVIGDHLRHHHTGVAPEADQLRERLTPSLKEMVSLFMDPDAPDVVVENNHRLLDGGGVFFAGASIKIDLGGEKVAKLGAVFVIDVQPRSSFGVKDKQFLVNIADIVSNEMAILSKGSERLAAMVDEVNEEQQRYITCTAHDLNTPLTVFKLANSHLKEHFQEKKSEKCSSSSSNNNTAGRRGCEGNRADQRLREDDELLEIIDQAHIAIEMMEETVHNAIDSARARWTTTATPRLGDDANAVSSPAVPPIMHITPPQLFPAVNMRDLLGECQKLHNRHHGEALSVSVEVDDEVPKEVCCDAPVLKRVLTNFLTNAFKNATGLSAAAAAAPSDAKSQGVDHHHHHPQAIVAPPKGPPTQPDSLVADPPDAPPPVPPSQSPSPPLRRAKKPAATSVPPSTSLPSLPSASAGGLVQRSFDSAVDEDRQQGRVPVRTSEKAVSTPVGGLIRRPFYKSTSDLNRIADPLDAPPPVPPTSPPLGRTKKPAAISVPPSASSPSLPFSLCEDGTSSQEGRVLIRAALLSSTKGPHSPRFSPVPGSSSFSSADGGDGRRWLRLEVHDNGPGVPSEMQGRLFTGAFVNSQPPASIPDLSTAAAAAAPPAVSGGDPESPLSPPTPLSSSGTVGSFTGRQGSGLGLFVVNMCVRQFGGACGFKCANGSSGRGSDLDGNPCSFGEPSEPLLGGAVFWFDVPLELDDDDDDDDDGNSGGCFDQQGTQTTCQTTENDSESFDSVQQEREAQDQFVAEGSLSVFAGSATSSGVEAPGIDSDARKPLSSPREVKTLLLPCATAPRTRSLSGRSKRWRQAPRSTSWGSSKSLSSTGTESPRQSPLNSPTGSDSWGSPRFFPPHFFKDVEEELEKPKLEAEEEAQAEKVFPASSRRVLVVDDSVMLQKLLKASLTRLDYQVETAKNGREALEKMTKGSEPYLVVLMDFLMPVLDGVSATAMFREWERTALKNAALGALTQTGSRDADDSQLRPRQYVIGMSANAEAADIEAAKSAGMDLFMPKPVKVAEIAKHIARQGQLGDESKGTSRLACRI